MNLKEKKKQTSHQLINLTEKGSGIWHMNKITSMKYICYTGKKILDLDSCSFK